jgi:periplasmic divalent cation tolerance protein
MRSPCKGVLTEVPDTWARRHGFQEPGPALIDLACAEPDNAAMSALIVFCTCPDEAVADRIALSLIQERLAACVNRLPGVTSTYRWQGAVRRDTEVQLLIKTSRARFDALRDRILALHPYELPEVVAVDIALGSQAYLAWIESETHI